MGIYEYETKGAGVCVYTHPCDQIMQRQMRVYLYLFIIPRVCITEMEVYLGVTA